MSTTEPVDRDLRGGGVRRGQVSRADERHQDDERDRDESQRLFHGTPPFADHSGGRRGRGACAGSGSVAYLGIQGPALRNPIARPTRDFRQGRTWRRNRYSVSTVNGTFPADYPRFLRVAGFAIWAVVGSARARVLARSIREASARRTLSLRRLDGGFRCSSAPRFLRTTSRGAVRPRPQRDARAPGRPGRRRSRARRAAALLRPGGRAARARGAPARRPAAAAGRGSVDPGAERGAVRRRSRCTGTRTRG